MKVIIVEDEQLAAERLTNLISQYDTDMEVVAILDSVGGTIDWLKAHHPPELAFFDIQLADGISLDIFNQVETRFPVIFTTAYNQYAIDAFKVNGIAYLLKPINLDDLRQAFQKYDALKQSLSGESSVDLKYALDLLHKKIETRHNYKKRFVVKHGSQIVAIAVESVFYFFTANKMTWIRHKNGNKYHLDIPLDQLTDKLDPTQFFRINRQYIIAFNAIQSIKTYSGSRLKIELFHNKEGEVVVSRERVGDFKTWLDQ